MYLKKEMIMLEHIDPDTKELTEFGRETLRLNKDAQGTRVQSCQNFDSVVRVHIDPLTGSLIPQYLEWELANNFEPDPQLGDFLKPRDSASVDEAFRDELRERLTNELNERKDEYVSLDTMKNGDILNHVDRFNPILVFYRWGYLAKFKEMRSPMIILTGKKNIGNVNADTAATGIQSEFVAVPIALCRTDYAYLQRHGITFDQTMVHDDDCFDELIAEIRQQRSSRLKLALKALISLSPIPISVLILAGVVLCFVRNPQLFQPLLSSATCLPAFGLP